jgi:uncharacterized protein (TIGR02996 family)
MAHDPELLQAILDHPADDQLRLIYADWLDERADPLGEFIRVQIALAGLQRDAPGHRQLYLREIELILRYKEEWFPLRKAFTSWECRRGFMDEARGDAGKFLEVVQPLLASQPVRIVYLEGADSFLDQLADCPALERLAQLTLTNWRRSGTRRNTRNRDLAEIVRSSPGLSKIPLIDYSGVRGQNRIHLAFRNGAVVEQAQHRNHRR